MATSARSEGFCLGAAGGFFLALAAVFLSGIPAVANASGSSAEKPPWKWTTSERLAERFSPASLEARATDEAREQKEWSKKLKFPASGNEAFAQAESAAANPGHDLLDSVSGRKHPELFLPSELFDDLLLRGFSHDGDQREQRLLIEDRAAALGFGSDFWVRLKKAAAPYLELQIERDRRARVNPPRATEDESTMDAEGLHWCRVRADALSAAKAVFGEEPLLRLLYTAVAPGHNRTYTVRDFSEHSRYLLYLEGGCR